MMIKHEISFGGNGNLLIVFPIGVYAHSGQRVIMLFKFLLDK